MSELTQYGARAFTLAGVLCALWSCAPELPIGRFACSSDADCPDGWSCGPNARGAQRCFPEGSDYRAVRTGDSSVPDPNATDASEPPDSGSAPDPDAGSGSPKNPPIGTPKPPAAGSGSGTGGAAPTAGGSGGAAGTPAAGSGGSTAGTGGTTMPPTQPDCTPDDADPALGVFVSPGGSVSETCGTPADPCATIAHAMARPSTLAQRVIYLDRGKYAEAISLRPGVAIRGAYERGAGRWTRSCAVDRATYSRIESTSEIGVLAEYTGAAELETLSVTTLAKVPMGHSTYGVFARGASTQLTLREVEVDAAPGGDGQTGNSGATPGPRTGTCAPASDGANGATDGAPGPGAAAGMIDSSGYVPGDGAPGDPGQPGHNGTPGSNTCRVCYDSCDTTTCTGVTASESCGVPGSPGCGGAAAEGGAGGGGGGSSFGLFAWGAKVQVVGGLLRSGKGGRGGSGGNPGNGGEGSDGSAGSNGPTCQVCVKSSGPITPPPPSPDTEVQAAKRAADIAAPVDRVPVDGGVGGIVIPIACVQSKAAGVGTAGGRGGKGSRGGVGGGGAGGSSYGVWAGGSAQLDVSASTRIEIGEAGRSMSSGAKGESMATKFSN